MAGMDSLFLEAVVGELQELLPGSRISKIYQPAAAEVIFKLWSRGSTRRLLLSCEADRSRLHLVEGSYPNPAAPPRFCQLLRARLLALNGLELVAGERIVRLTFAGSNEARYQLIAELTGKSANLILVDEQGLVVDALKRVPAEQGRGAIIPGALYMPPAPLAGQLLDEEVPELPSRADDPRCFEEWLTQRVRPMSRLAAGDLAAQVAAGGNPRHVLADFIDRRRRDYRFSIVMLKNRPLLTCLPLQALVGQELGHFNSPSAAAEAFYQGHQHSSDQYGPAGAMRTLVARTMKKLRRRRDRIVADEQKSARAEELRQRGELLLSQLHRVQPGADAVELENYYLQPPQPVTIELDPRLSPQENAEKFFRAYKKVKRSREHIARRLAETEDEMAWLEGVSLALAEAQGGEEFLAVRRELQQHGLLTDKGTQAVRRQQNGSIPGVRETLSPNGFRIYWGVNNRANDYVSKKLCSAEDLWFHAQDMPGCHLVLKCGDQRPVPEADRLFAAALAAGYSRGKNDGTVEVMVSEGRWVVKPKGAKPGLVTVRQHQTLRVAPIRQDSDETPRG